MSEYRGHGTGAAHGLQVHSTGPEYPWFVRGEGPGDEPTKYRGCNLVTGIEFALRDTYSLAHEDVVEAINRERVLAGVHAGARTWDKIATGAYDAATAKCATADAIERGALAAGVTDRHGAVLVGGLCAPYFARLGPNGLHCSVLGLAILGAGPLCLAHIDGLYDHEREAYGRQILATLPADEVAAVHYRATYFTEWALETARAVRNGYRSPIKNGD